VPALHRLVQRLRAHLQGQREQELRVHEQGVLAAWRAEPGALLSAGVACTTTGADAGQRPPRSACPHCGQGCAAERWRPRTVQTCLGVVTLRRAVYRCGRCGQRWARAERPLGLAPGRLVVETDGVFVRYRCRPGCCRGGWHETTRGIVGGWVDQRPAAVLQQPSYVAAPSTTL